MSFVAVFPHKRLNKRERSLFFFQQELQLKHLALEALKEMAIVLEEQIRLYRDYQIQVEGQGLQKYVLPSLSRFCQAGFIDYAMLSTIASSACVFVCAYSVLPSSFNG